MPQGMPYDLFVQALRRTFPEDFQTKTPKQVVDDWLADFPELEGVLDPSTRFILEGTEGLPELQQRELGISPPAPPPRVVGGVSGLPPVDVTPYGRQPSTLEQAGLIGARVAPALIGAAVTGPFAAFGGAGGAIAGEALATGYEEATGIAPGSHLNILAQGAIGAAPVIKWAGKIPGVGPTLNRIAQSVAGRIGLTGLEGAVQGAASVGAEIPLRWERPPSMGELAFGAGVGSAFGAGVGGGAEAIRSARSIRAESRLNRAQLRNVEAFAQFLETESAAGNLVGPRRIELESQFKSTILPHILDPTTAASYKARVENIIDAARQQELRQIAATYVENTRGRWENMGLHERMVEAQAFTDRLRENAAEPEIIEQTSTILAGLTTAPEPTLPKGIAGLLPPAPAGVQESGIVRPLGPPPPPRGDVTAGPGTVRDVTPPPPTIEPPGPVRPPGGAVKADPATPVDWRESTVPPTYEEIRQRARDESPGAGILSAIPDMPAPSQLSLRLKPRPSMLPPAEGETAVPGPLGREMVPEGIETLPRVQAGEVTPDRAFMLSWIAEDLRQFSFEEGDIRTRADVDYAPDWNVEMVPRIPGTPILFALRALGAGSKGRGAIAEEIEKYLNGTGTRKPTKQVQAALKLAEMWEQAYTPEGFDFSRSPLPRPTAFDSAGKPVKRAYTPMGGGPLLDWAKQPRWLVEKYAPDYLAPEEIYPKTVPPTRNLTLDDTFPPLNDPQTWIDAPVEARQQLNQLTDQDLLELYDQAIRYGGYEPPAVGWMMAEITERGLRDYRQPGLKTEGPGTPGNRDLPREIAESQGGLFDESLPENPTPELDLPFALTPEVAQGPKGQQGDLFGTEPPKFGEKGTPAKGKLPSLFDDERGGVGQIPPTLPGTGRAARAPRNLTFAGEAFDQLQSVAKAGAGREVAGILLGYPDGSIARVVPMKNVAGNPTTTFELSPTDLASVLKQARREGLELLASYHTQPTGSAAPSKLDMRGSVADVPLVILGMDGGDLTDARVWQPGKNRQWAEGTLGVATIRNPQTPPAFRSIRDVKQFVRAIPRLRSGPGDSAGLTRWFDKQRGRFEGEAWFVEAEKLLQRGQSREAWLKVQTVQLLGERAARAGLKTMPDPVLSKQATEMVDSLARGGAQDPVGALFALFDGRTVTVKGAGRVVVGPDIPPDLQGGDVFVGPGGLLRPGDRKSQLAGSLTDGTLALKITNAILEDVRAEGILKDPTGVTDTKLFRQVTEQFMLSPANFKAVKALIDSGELTLEEIAQQYQHAISTSARQLAALSVWQRRNQAAIRQIQGIYGAAGDVDDLVIRGDRGRIIGRLGDLTEGQTFQDLVRPTRAWDRAMLLNDLSRPDAGAFRQLEAASRGFMISQFATAARNFVSAGIRSFPELLDAAGEVLAYTGTGRPDHARKAWYRLVERAKVPYTVTRDGLYVTPWKARKAEFAAIYEAMSGDGGRLLKLLQEVNPEDSHLLGGVAFGEPTPHGKSKYRILNAIADPKFQNTLTMFNRAQEFTVRAGIYTAELRAGLRAAGVDPNQIEGLSAARLSELVGGDEKLQALLHDAVHQALNFSFAGNLITKGFGKDDLGKGIGSVPAYVVQQLNRFPLFRTGYPFPRFNLSAAPRFLWDHSLIGLAVDPLYARVAKRGRYFLGQKAELYETTAIPEADRKIAAAEREMGDALLGRMTLQRRLKTYETLIRRAEKQAAAPALPGTDATKTLNVLRGEVDSLKERLGAMQSQFDIAQSNLKDLQSQRRTLAGVVQTAREANAPRTFEQLLARNLFGGGALLAAAYVTRSLEGAEGTPWYILKVPKPFGMPGEQIELDFRPFAPFAQYLFVADVLKDAFEYTNWTAVAEDWEAGRGFDWYSHYEGKYTKLTYGRELGNAFLSMSQAAGTTLALADALLELPTQGVPSTGYTGETVMRAIGSFFARFTIPFVQVKAVTDLIDDDESKARIIDADQTTGTGWMLPAFQAIGNLPFLGTILVPETVNQITGKPLDTYAPLVRALTGVTARERTQLQDVLTEAGVPGSSIYLRDTGDPFLDRLLGFHYANILNRVLPQILDDPEWQRLNSPALRRDFLQKLLPKLKQSAIGQTLEDTDPEQLQSARETPEGKRRRLRMERLQQLIDQEGLRNLAGEPEAPEVEPPALGFDEPIEPTAPSEVEPPSLGAAGFPGAAAPGYGIEPPRMPS